MTYDPDDTIVAIGTAAGGSPRGMVRLSGPAVLSCLQNLFTPADTAQVIATIRRPCLVPGSFNCHEPDLAEVPCDLFLWPNERSYTRQPTAELHTLGSPPLLAQLVKTICDHGARLAEPGEFTLRAFLAGRLDLTQAEAVLGVIDANSSTDLEVALTQLAGGLSQPLAQLREQLLQLLAELEAGLDFAEEDIEFISSEQLTQQLSAARIITVGVLEQLSSRSEASDLPRVVLSGPPNAGKSSLFNALVERYGKLDANVQALVSEQSGTTRDFVTATITENGVARLLVDTAGVESPTTAVSIDRMAQSATELQLRQASLVVRCVDGRPIDHDGSAADDGAQLTVTTKSDLLTTPLHCTNAQLACSSFTGAGLQDFASLLSEKLKETNDDAKATVSNTAARCVDSLRQADDSLGQALQLVTARGGEELIAAEVRTTLHALGQVVGVVYTDDILDRIFGQFCIGK